MPTRFRTRPAQNAARIEQRQECSQKADLPRPMLGGMGRCGARKAGFTIAELLIVVAIVGVLVAIAIPVFTSQLEKAQEATCLANRRSVKGLVVADYLDSHTELTSERFAELVAEVGPNLCPNGGEYGYEGTVEGGGGIVITCSVHGGGEGKGADEELLDFITAHKDELWKKPNGGDKDVWSRYASLTGQTEWPKVKGTDGNSLNLMFKTFNNDSSGSFLYATSMNTSFQDHGQWKAEYVCDTQGLIGEPGQWYRFDKPRVVAQNSSEKWKADLAGGTKVSLVDGQFVEQ